MSTEKEKFARLLTGFEAVQARDTIKKLEERAAAHAAVLIKHGFKRCGTTKSGSHRFKHPSGASAYYSYSPSKKGWRTRLKFRGMWGWTGRFYASAENLDRWMTAHK